jgi:hypothetical protein
MASNFLPSPLTTEIIRRDFSQPVTNRLPIEPDYLSWTAFGGAERAELGASGEVEQLLDLIHLLRCGVMIRDKNSEPVWWGYIEEVVVELEAVEVRVSLADLANEIRVQYDYVSPDNVPGDRNLTDAAVDQRSQAEYGAKTRLLHKSNIDQGQAEALRDTWLGQHAWPISRLSQRDQRGKVRARLICAGWFKTLDWQPYTLLEGFYANYGPGPGAFAFGRDSSAQFVGQSFRPGEECALKTASFMLRKVGAPTRTITARLHADNSGQPGAVLATSAPFSPVDLLAEGYTWATFDFASSYPLTGGERYWITVDPHGLNGSQYFMVRVDQNMTYAGGTGRYYAASSGTWHAFPPADQPDLFFRAVCVSDTLEQLLAIAAHGGQFFTRITAETTGVAISPYRKAGETCLAEIRNLMELGTQNQRLMLAAVTPQRQLRFYEQNQPKEPDLYMDNYNRFFNRQGVLLPPWHPPVGRFARFSGTSRINHPWDRQRLPACFVAGAEYWPQTGKSRIRAVDGEHILEE